MELTPEQKEAAMQLGRARGHAHMSLYAALCQGHQLDQAKKRTPALWRQLLDLAGIDDVYARFLLNLARDHDNFVGCGGTHWEFMEKMLAVGVADKLAGFAPLKTTLED